MRRISIAFLLLAHHLMCQHNVLSNPSKFRNHLLVLVTSIHLTQSSLLTVNGISKVVFRTGGIEFTPMPYERLWQNSWWIQIDTVRSYLFESCHKKHRGLQVHWTEIAFNCMSNRSLPKTSGLVISNEPGLVRWRAAKNLLCFVVQLQWSCMCTHLEFIHQDVCILLTKKFLDSWHRHQRHCCAQHIIIVHQTSWTQRCIVEQHHLFTICDEHRLSN